MTLISAMNAAVSGLSAVSRGVQVVSSNVANATTPDYGVRSVTLTTRQHSSGVNIASVNRASDAALLDMRHQANANAAELGSATAFWQGLDKTVGNPEQPGALTNQITAFSVAILDAAANPESAAKLSNIRISAEAIVQKINNIESHIQAERTAADRSIQFDVNRLNEGLLKIDALNKSVTRAIAEGRDALGLMDSRENIISSISDIIPLQQIAREDGRIELMSTGGLVLLDRKPATFDFLPTRSINADMHIEHGDLSGVTVNGRQLLPSSLQIAGGALAAAFEIRDTHAPNAQSRLDELAQDLVTRFANPAADPTLAPGDPGLFTIAGASTNGPNLTGSAGRLAINQLIDPRKGGAEWRIRSGLSAAVPGPVGSTTHLMALGAAIENRTSITPDASNQSYLSNAAALSSFIGASYFNVEGSLGYVTGRLSELSELASRNGVDPDKEMQQLLRLEQAYAANARVIKTIDELMRQILGL